MKICYVCGSTDPTEGGSCKYNYEITNQLRKMGVDLDILSLRKFCESKNNIYGVLCKLIFGWIVAILTRNVKYGAYYFEGTYLGTAAFLLRKRKIPIIVITHGQQLSIMKATISRFRYCRAKDFVAAIVQIILFFNELIENILCDTLVCLTTHAKRMWIDLKVNEKKIRVIPYGINLDTYHQKNGVRNKTLKKVGLDAGDSVVLYVGHIQPFRNIDKIIESVSKISNQKLKLLIVGDGSTEKLRMLAKRLGIDDRVVFFGHVSDQNFLADIYNSADILVLPHTPGVVFMEAMACGIPIITVKNKLNISEAIDEKLLECATILDDLNTDVLKRTIINKMEKRTNCDICNYRWQKVAKSLINLE